MGSRHPPMNAWDPMDLPDVAAQFDSAPFRWWIAGGRALELHAGRGWRLHADTDVGVIRSEAGLVFEWLGGWEMWVAAEGVLSPWDGRDLSALAGENNVWVVCSDTEAWCLDLTVGAGTDAEWIYRRDEAIRRPWRDAVLVTPDGLPYLAPELQMLFKSKSRRPKDDVDAREVFPSLSGPQRRLLMDHLPAGHPWCRMLVDP